MGLRVYGTKSWGRFWVARGKKGQKCFGVCTKGEPFLRNIHVYEFSYYPPSVRTLPQTKVPPFVKIA